MAQHICSCLHFSGRVWYILLRTILQQRGREKVLIRNTNRASAEIGFGTSLLSCLVFAFFVTLELFYTDMSFFCACSGRSIPFLRVVEVRDEVVLKGSADFGIVAYFCVFVCCVFVFVCAY